MDEQLKQQIREIVRQEADKLISDTQTVDQFAVAQTAFHTHNGIDSQKFPFLNLSDVPNSYYNKAGNVVVVSPDENGLVFTPCFMTLSKSTNGTTNVDVFGASGAPFAFTITGVYLISLDTTAGNVTVLNAGNTVCTIAKGTTSGAMVGATSLSSTSVAKKASFQVDSSSAGNATVFISFTTSI